MRGKVQFSISVDPAIATELERIRGETSRSLVVEAILIECLGMSDEIEAAGRRHY